MAAPELRDSGDGVAAHRTGPAGPDVLALAPRPVPRGLVRTALAGAVVLLLALSGYAVWRSRQPPPDLTLAQLESAYAGTVPSDGTNDVSIIDPADFVDVPLQISPGECMSLFASRVSNQFPVGAVDGVSTYWLDGPSSVSLFTVRYPDVGDAQRAYDEVVTALRACDGRTVRVSAGQGTGTLRAVPGTPGDGTEDQLAYLLERPVDEGRYALHLLRLSNSVTWQYRYEPPNRVLPVGSSPAVRPYDPLPAQRLVDGLAHRLVSIQTADASR